MSEVKKLNSKPMLSLKTVLAKPLMILGKSDPHICLYTESHRLLPNLYRLFPAIHRKHLVVSR
jgi:hypothetical protein